MRLYILIVRTSGNINEAPGEELVPHAHQVDPTFEGLRCRFHCSLSNILTFIIDIDNKE